MSIVEPVTPSNVALIEDVPVASAGATPIDPDAFEIVAVAVFAEAHVIWFVRFSVEPSANVPVAVNCCVSPLGTLGSAGAIAIDSSVGVTESVVLPVIPSTVALIVALPFATPVASPCEPDVLEMLATEVVPDVQFTAVVRFWVVLSENVPVTLNCSVLPISMNGSAGVTASDLSTAEPTVSTVEPVTPSIVALIVVVPCPTPVATPCDPEASEIGRHRGRTGGPADRARQVLRRVVGERSRSQ